MTTDEACKLVEAAFAPLFPRVVRKRLDQDTVCVLATPGRDQGDRQAAAIYITRGNVDGLEAEISRAVADICKTDARWLPGPPEPRSGTRIRI